MELTSQRVIPQTDVQVDTCAERISDALYECPDAYRNKVRGVRTGGTDY